MPPDINTLLLPLDVDVIIHIMIKSEYTKSEVRFFLGDDNIPKEHVGCSHPPTHGSFAPLTF